jgi:hypothetical protein
VWAAARMKLSTAVEYGRLRLLMSAIVFKTEAPP